MREIEKAIPSPVLLPITVQHLNHLCFTQPEYTTGPCDAVLIFGTSREINREQIVVEFASVCHLFSPRVVYITGGESEPGTIESERIYSGIQKFGDYSRYNFRLDRSSKNTKENVERALDLGLGDHKNIVFITKAPHTGRCILTLRKYLPNAVLRHKCYDPIMLPEVVVRRSTWHENETMRNLMWAEFVRIERYGTRGDIHYPPAVEGRVKEIRLLTRT